MRDNNWESSLKERQCVGRFAGKLSLSYVYFLQNVFVYSEL